MIVDTHIHFTDEKYTDIIEDVLDRAYSNNVNLLYIIACDKKSTYEVLDFCDKYNNYKNIKTYPIIGLHPQEVNFESDKDLNWLKELLINQKAIAIGEIGIDLYWDKSNLDLQIAYFKKQLDFAKEFNLKVSIHSREAIQITYDILKEYKGVSGVIHCFSGSVEMAKEFIKLGYKLGIGGVLTYKNSNLYKVIEAIDLKHFVTETDGPYLSPVPYRGKTNEPTYIKEIIKKISEIKGLDYNEVEDILYQNALELFGEKND